MDVYVLPPTSALTPQSVTKLPSFSSPTYLLAEAGLDDPNSTSRGFIMVPIDRWLKTRGLRYNRESLDWLDRRMDRLIFGREDTVRAN